MVEVASENGSDDAAPIATSSFWSAAGSQLKSHSRVRSQAH